MPIPAMHPFRPVASVTLITAGSFVTPGRAKSTIPRCRPVPMMPAGPPRRSVPTVGKDSA